MPRYFVGTDGALAGEVLVEHPANPQGLRIIEVGSLPAPANYCRYDGAAVEAFTGWQQAEADKLASGIRADRAKRLAGCDWTQARDLPADFSAAWEPYRQALRDITAQATFPQSVIWPEAPQ